MSNVFVNLLSLYKNGENSQKTPLEDYTTEIFASILSKDQILLDSFVNEILDIDGKGFCIKTQQLYGLEDDQDCVVDIVIYNESSICFLENKVNSFEGKRQLERYQKLLDQLSSNQKIFLRYCTKYYDIKEVKGVNFHQIRWSHVYTYLKKLNQEKKDSIIEDFLGFMRRMDMASPGNFNFNDMVVLNHFVETMSKMDECLDSVTHEFTELFGDPIDQHYFRIKSIPKYNRYTFSKKGVISGGEDHQSKIILGFELFEQEITEYPIVALSLMINKNHPEYQNVKEEIKADGGFYVYEAEGAFWGWYEKPLSDFLSEEDQMRKIKEWFIDRMNDLNKFIENTKGLGWNVR